ncbi:MAG: 2-oxoacid:acceptor oxidoreductase family protein [Anaerolineae bacterium]
MKAKTMAIQNPKSEVQNPKYPGRRVTTDGNSAVVWVETAASEAAGAYPITPSTQMGEGWAEAVAAGKLNAFGRPLIFIEPEGEHAAAGVTAGLAMVGLRSVNFSSGQGIAYMHESLYAAVGKRLTYVLNVASRAITKQSLNVHAGHDDFHAVDDTGFFQVFGKNAQQAADLCLIAHRVAELSLTPGLNAMDGFLTSHVLETVWLPEPELVAEFLGSPDDIIDCPTPAQRMVYGPKRRRIPEAWDVDNPAQIGVVQNQDSYAQGVAAQRPFFFDHVKPLARQTMAEYYRLTGRRYDFIEGYRLADADYVIVGLGSMVENAEAVVDYLRQTRGLKVGVLGITWYRPFPGPEIAAALKGKKGVAVLERVDQPLAEDLPLLKEVRAAVDKALENGGAKKLKTQNSKFKIPYPDYPIFHRFSDRPQFYSGSYGLGSRDLQPEQLVATFENMLPEGAQRRLFYLGFEFIDEDTFFVARREMQEQVKRDYPHVPELNLPPAENPNLLPDGSVAVRIHSVGGWGAITTGKNLTATVFDLLGMYVKSNPKYGSEKKGQPTTYYAVFAPEPIRTNGDLKYVDVVMSPDPNVFKHSNPLAGLKEGGTFIWQSSEGDPHRVWDLIPPGAQQEILDKNYQVYYLDAFKIAREEATNPDLQFRMQGNVFQGAFFAASPLMANNNLTREMLFEAIHKQLEAKFGKKGRQVVEDNLRVVQRGFDELHHLDSSGLAAGQVSDRDAPAFLPRLLPTGANQTPLTVQDRFWGDTGSMYTQGQGHNLTADPFAAYSVTPAATGVFRDMTNIRFEYPKFIPEKCTGCANCWTQCPDSAIPGLVLSTESILKTAIAQIPNAQDAESPAPAMAAIAAELQTRTHALLLEADSREGSLQYHGLSQFVEMAFTGIVNEMNGAGEALRAEWPILKEILDDFPVAQTKAFFSLPERKNPGNGGLLAITVNPETCKGCMECVEVCPDEALVPVPQTDESVARLQRGWSLWQDMPDTAPDYIKIASLDEGIGTLSSLLLSKQHYLSMTGGDGACMGCGEKTPIHLLVAAAHALMMPRVEAHVARLEDLIARLEAEIRDEQARLTNPAEASVLEDRMGVFGQQFIDSRTLSSHLPPPPTDMDDARLKRLERTHRALADLHWRYTSGPSGRGRAPMGMVNDTGCTTVWGSTYPYNPYPIPWTNHLFQDAPSVAMGLFEGNMRKMADGFKAIRTAELELAGEYDPNYHDRFFTYFDWNHFSDEEWRLCPAIIAMGGDGAMLDIGFQNLSRMLASGKPIKAVIVDTQVYSNTGGQASTGTYLSQVSDMAAYGPAHQGKEEPRKEAGLIGLAHRNTYVAQTSAAAPSHMLAAFIEGLNSRRPALFNIYTACQPEHGVADDVSARQARLALEGRAFPFLRYNPDAGGTIAECLSLEGNPFVDSDWPTYTLKYRDETNPDTTCEMELPYTFADFAASEGRFAKHFSLIPADAPDEGLVPFHEYLPLPAQEREGVTPFIWMVDDANRLRRAAVSESLVASAEDRLHLWHLLQEMAGVRSPVADKAAEQARRETAAAFEARLEALEEQHQAELKAAVAQARAEAAQRIAGGLVSLVNGEGVLPAGLDLLAGPSAAESPAAEAKAEAATGVEAAPVEPEPVPNGKAAAPVEPDADDGQPWIDTLDCTTCGECLAVNPRMFKYNEDEQAYLADPAAGPYRDLVVAAERCPVEIIYPGQPLNPDEDGLEKWLQRAERFG